MIGQLGNLGQLGMSGGARQRAIILLDYLAQKFGYVFPIGPAATVAARSAMGATLNDTSKWYGGVLGPDGKIYCVPAYSTDILIVQSSGTMPTRVLLSSNLNKF
jgi:hypothetical protein